MRTIEKTYSLVLASLLIVSCSQSQISFTSYTSSDSSYVLEIPSDIPVNKCAGKIMSFKNDQTFITIMPMPASNIEEYVANDKYKGDFDYELIQSSDTSNFYKITKGASMFFAYQLYMLKELDSERFLISLYSIENKSTAVKIINHIYSSLKLKKEDSPKRSGNIENNNRIYSNKFFSVKYPNHWKYIENIDAMTDVYIGSEKENFGFTVVRFETDETLDEINNEGNESIRNSEFIKLIKEERTTVDGLRCYQTIQKVDVDGNKVKHLSYSFKKGKCFYNVKFGNVINDTQEKQAQEIINTFKVK